jgi:hypothetical protein
MCSEFPVCTGYVRRIGTAIGVLGIVVLIAIVVYALNSKSEKPNGHVELAEIGSSPTDIETANFTSSMRGIDSTATASLATL